MLSILLQQEQIELIINRLSREIIESNINTDIFIIGVQPRGTSLAEKIYDKIANISNKNICYGTIDDTFHRDDFKRGKLIQPSSSNINFDINNKHIILVDDVLFTGRTIRAAIEALLVYGRPSKIELLVLIDRKFNRELPIHPDYVGKIIDTIENTKVTVLWNDEHYKDAVLFIN